MAAGRLIQALWLVLAVLAPGVAAAAQPEEAPEPAPVEPAPPPELAAPVSALLGAEYLTDEERKDLRVFHGLWTEEDLDTPARRARAALIRGAIDDPALAEPAAPAEDRAEAMVRRGELEEALALLDSLDSVRAMRLRAEALESLGRADEAAAAVEPILAALSTRETISAADLTEAVRALLVRGRVREPERTGGGDYKAMVALLARARDRLDRLHWPAYVVEAQLLYEKDNAPQAAEALLQALSLNPACAEAWRLLGRLSVDQFDFAQAASVAARLDHLARDAAGAAPGVASPWAALIRARARLRQSDPDGADAALAPVLAALPRMRPALALRVAAAGLRYDFEHTDRLLAEFDALSPGSPEAVLALGAALSEARQYEAAARYLAEAARRAPHRPEPYIELGLLHLQSGNDIAALDALRRATRLDPFNIRAGNSLKLVEELIKYERVESEHFIVRYRPGPDAVLAADMLGVMEANHRRVAGPDGIDHEPARKTTIDLMPDHRWFSVRIAGLPKIHTMAAATGPVIALESPREGAGHSVAAYDWPRVLRHEYTHTVTLSRTHNRIPHWFTEAAAVYMEEAPRDYNTCTLLAEALRTGNLFDLERINLGFVRPRTPRDRPLAYAQGHWMYQYMVERYGRGAPLELMDRYAAGERQDSAMRAVLGVEPERFLEDFKAWAREQVRAWGLTPPEGQPTLAALLLEEAASTDDGRRGLAERLAAFARDCAWAAAGGGTGLRSGPAWRPRTPHPDQAMIDRWLEAYPSHPEVLEVAVQRAVAAAGGEPDEPLIPLLERYAAARPVDPLPHRLLAKMYLDAVGPGPSAAIPHLEYLDARETMSPTYAAALARRYAAAGDWEKAAAKAERAVRIAPFDGTLRELAATIALQSGDHEAAERHITALTIIEPDRDIHRRRLEALKKLREEGAMR